eukprot:s104_g2.t1
MVEFSASYICTECEDALCSRCSAQIHRVGARQNHTLFGLRKAAYSKRLFADNLDPGRPRAPRGAMAAAVAAAVRRRDENRRAEGDDGDAVVRAATKSTLVAEDLLPPWLGWKWIDPEGDQHPGVWLGFDIFFNVSFTIELMWNMYSFWLCRFWKSAWNIFDVVVVTIGLMNYVLPDLPGPLGLLRMMRAFRVFRLFKRVESLRKIMQSLSKAVPGVANAFFIQVLVMSIYAILGVEFFMNYGETGSYTNELGEIVEITTARDLQYGYEYFGNFGKALFTMFQVLTGESWSEVVTRPMNPTQAIGVSFFFVSFNLINGIVLINVAIAVLLEKMVDDESDKHHHVVQEESDSEPQVPPSIDFDEVQAFTEDDYDKVAIPEDTPAATKTKSAASTTATTQQGSTVARSVSETKGAKVLKERQTKASAALPDGPDAMHVKSLMGILQRNIERSYDLSPWFIFYDQALAPSWYNFTSYQMVRADPNNLVNPPIEEVEGIPKKADDQVLRGLPGATILKDTHVAQLTAQGACFDVPPPVHVKFAATAR